MARTRLAPAVRRAQLLDAASTVFARSGFHASTLQDVAEEAGVAKALVHRYFTSKADLIDALLARRGDECAEGLRSNVLHALEAHQNDAAAVIRAALEAWLEKLAEDVAAGRWVGDPEHRRLAEPYYERLSSTIVELLLATRPSLPPDSARVVAAMLMAATEAAAMLTTFSDGEVPQQTATAVAAAFCAAGLDGVTGQV